MRKQCRYSSKADVHPCPSPSARQEASSDCVVLPLDKAPRCSGDATQRRSAPHTQKKHKAALAWLLNGARKRKRVVLPANFAPLLPPQSCGPNALDSGRRASAQASAQADPVGVVCRTAGTDRHGPCASRFAPARLRGGSSQDLAQRISAAQASAGSRFCYHLTVARYPVALCSQLCLQRAQPLLQLAGRSGRHGRRPWLNAVFPTA